MQAVSFIRGCWAPKTQSLYGQGWRDFSAWCDASGVEALPARPEAVAEYLNLCAVTLATSTISLRRQAIFAAHAMRRDKARTAKERERFAIDSKTPEIADAWAGIKRAKGTASTPKEALSPEEIRQMAALMPPHMIQNRAVLLIHYAGAMRRSETVALNCDDLEFSDDNLIITIRRSKTDKSGRGEPICVARTHAAFCPVKALEEWLSDSGITSGAIFLSSRGNRMAPARVAQIYKRWAKKIGRDPRKIGAHSGRRGCISAINDAGVNMRDGMAHSRHKTPAIYLGYIEKKTITTNPAVHGIAKALAGALA